MPIGSELRGIVHGVETGVQVWWQVPSADVSAEAADAQNLAQMVLRARRMGLAGSSTPVLSGLAALMKTPTSAVLVVADKAVHAQECDDGSGGCHGIAHHDTRVGFLVADALGFELVEPAEAEGFGKRVGSQRVAAEEGGGSTEGAGRCR